MRRRLLALAAVALTLAACADPSRVPTAPAGPNGYVHGEDVGRETAAARWQALAVQISGRRTGGPMVPARNFALMSVARYNGVLAARAAGASLPGAAAGAAAAVLGGLFPIEQPVIDAQLHADAAYFASGGGGSFAAGMEIGRAAGEAVLAYAASDGTNDPWTGTLPVGDGYWYSAPGAAPGFPEWATARPWVMTSPDEVRPGPPPAFGSPEFQASLHEIRYLSDTRTAEQLRIAQYWVTGTGPAATPGYFGTMAARLAAAQGLDERETARMFAVLHMTIMDAGIACFDAKYAYMYVRPSQADPAITTPVGLPNFPSYPSNHSCLTSSAASVVAAFFPDETETLQALVVEAGYARMYGGLHYDFDITAGRQIGTSVARLMLERGPNGNDAILLR